MFSVMKTSDAAPALPCMTRRCLTWHNVSPIRPSQVIRMVGESQEPVGAGVGSSQTAGTNKTPTLQEYGTNLTTQAAEVSAAASSGSQ